MFDGRRRADRTDRIGGARLGRRAFGGPVVPLVKMINAASSSRHVSSNRHASPSHWSHPASSTLRSATRVTSGPPSATTASIASSNSSAWNTVVARDSSSACRSSGTGCDTPNGTATKPARHAASIAATYSGPGRARTPTRRPRRRHLVPPDGAGDEASTSDGDDDDDDDDYRTSASLARSRSAFVNCRPSDVTIATAPGFATAARTTSIDVAERRARARDGSAPSPGHHLSRRVRLSSVRRTSCISRRVSVVDRGIVDEKFPR